MIEGFHCCRQNVDSVTQYLGLSLLSNAEFNMKLEPISQHRREGKGVNEYGLLITWSTTISNHIAKSTIKFRNENMWTLIKKKKKRMRLYISWHCIRIEPKTSTVVRMNFKLETQSVVCRATAICKIITTYFISCSDSINICTV